MNMETYFRVTHFYTREASILDRRLFNEWLDLLADDIVYRMPVRITREERDGSNIVDDMTFFEDTKTSLNLRVKRLSTTSAWAENPAPRTRHFVSNILVESESDQELSVRSHFLLMRSRASETEIEQLFGERMDVLRKAGDGFKICSRTIIPDQTILNLKNLSMFL
ncbi:MULTISPECIES: aromatic-ring-hydroxylating dioxygenase subunit beta [Paenibacillus]|uniref:Putative naphthalene dioxygenase small subunit n=1 Tax=Paenibacillus sp. TSY30 TaxID=1051546 RepID=F7J920_9BACL|nr:MULTISPECIES: aromatic-ring-hydroxylating dioxygenase subunit beta [Paenibacillus]NTZ17421.1 3-phenylpropionate/cinnamic acid dioxygenase subunit beta [Paenibacillus sp. JMULE4]BAK48594.1 putative naphthalene dioxygenase small subunit [Paenibacillus sp. TSY30]GCL71954.1 aromatic-ring-hydroxylating dioxygenase [Paenibacillus naphthalenovorans]